MRVIQGFELKSDTDPTADSWLRDIINEMEKQDKSQSLISISVEQNKRQYTYTLHNRKAKCYATLSKRKSIIKLNIFQKHLPNIVKNIKPEFEIIYSLVEDCDGPKSKELLATRIVTMLCEDNPYSLGTVKKIKVTPTGVVSMTENTLVGGIIKEFMATDHSMIVTLDNGAAFEVKKSLAYEKNITALNYIVLGENENTDIIENFDVVDKNEFDHYFELIE